MDEKTTAGAFAKTDTAIYGQRSEHAAYWGVVFGLRVKLKVQAFVGPALTRSSSVVTFVMLGYGRKQLMMALRAPGLWSV